jgi:hypothetical protein
VFPVFGLLHADRKLHTLVFAFRAIRRREIGDSTMSVQADLTHYGEYSRGEEYPMMRKRLFIAAVTVSGAIPLLAQPAVSSCLDHCEIGWLECCMKNDTWCCVYEEMRCCVVDSQYCSVVQC